MVSDRERFDSLFMSFIDKLMLVGVQEYCINKTYLNQTELIHKITKWINCIHH